MKRAIVVFGVAISLLLAGCVVSDPAPREHYEVTQLRGTRLGVRGTRMGGAQLYNWMGQISDDKSIADITIPGTHDSAAFKSAKGPRRFVLAQTKSIQHQLRGGVRLLDIRLRYYDDSLTLHHDRWYLKQNFNDVIKTALQFLEQNPSETVIFMIKQEHSKENAKDFGIKVRGYIKEKGLKNFHLKQAGGFPTLGDVRGKIVIFRRFSKPSDMRPLGFYLSWPDNTKGDTQTKYDHTFFVQDRYKFDKIEVDFMQGYDTRINKKVGWIKHGIKLALKGGEDQKLFINFTSVYSKWHYLKTLANDINPKVDDFVQKKEGMGKGGVIIVNFAGSNNTDDYPHLTPYLVKHIIEINRFPEN